MKKNDIVLFYTDGFPEAMNRAVEFYSDERLINTMKANLNSESEIILKRLLDDVKNFVKDADQSDDITCGVVKIL